MKNYPQATILYYFQVSCALCYNHYQQLIGDKMVERSGADPAIEEQRRIDIEDLRALPRDEFFRVKRSQGVDLAYGDVRVATAPSDIDEHDVVLATRFSRNINNKNPFVSAAMDTVTEYRMAIAQEMLGGLGVLHAGLSTEETKEQVRWIKYSLTSAEIPKPKTVSPDQSLQNILNECEKNGWSFRSFPVIDPENNRFLGMLGGNVFKYKKFVLGDTTAEQAMTPLSQIAYGKPGITLKEAHAIMEEHEVGTVPILRKDHTLAGMYLWADVERVISGDAAKFSVDRRGRLLAVIAIRTREEEFDRVKEANGKDSLLDGVVMDTSQGDGKHAAPLVRLFKEEFPNIDIIPGNVDEPDGALKLGNAGSDGVKVGKGPGSICTTRLEIGIGCPQVTAVYNCVEALRGMDVPVCADGGIENFGDLNVAIAAGAESIMMGGMFAATDEAPGRQYTNEEGVPVMGYRGMGSEEVLLADHDAGRDRYGYQLGTVILPEGVSKELPFKGPVGPIVEKAALALRKGMAQSGHRTIEEHRENSRFRFSTNAGAREGRPHDVE